MPTQLDQRLSSCTGLGSILDCVLDTGLELTGASLGNIQLMDWGAGHLTINAQRGFRPEFLDFFRCVRADGGSACGRALRERSTVVIKDVMLDEDFGPYQAVAERAKFRSVQSIPLISSSGAFVGILSTHFHSPRWPTDCEMNAVRSLATLGANAIIRQRACLRGNDLEATKRCIHRASEAIRKSRDLLARLGGRSRDGDYEDTP